MPKNFPKRSAVSEGIDLLPLVPRMSAVAGGGTLRSACSRLLCAFIFLYIQYGLFHTIQLQFFYYRHVETYTIHGHTSLLSYSI